jgi:hypothetical protein
MVRIRLLDHQQIACLLPGNCKDAEFEIVDIEVTSCRSWVTP